MFDRSLCKEPSSLPSGLVNTGEGTELNETGRVTCHKKIGLVSVATVCDVVAAGFGYMSLVYIPVSVFQAFKGAMTVFTAIFSILILRKKHHSFHWFGVALASTGVTLVGVASVWGTDYEAAKGDGPADASVDSNLIIFGLVLNLCGQVAGALHHVVEEALFKDVEMPALRIVGFEGMCGVLIMLLVVFPVLYFLPGGDHGRQADIIDTLTMVVNSNSNIKIILALFIFTCFAFNTSGVAITGALSAVHRVMWNAFRTVATWVFGLCVHYFFDSKSRFGEVWTPYSYLALFGFVLVVFGQAIYGKMLIVPCLRYPSEHNIMEKGLLNEYSDD